MLWRLEKFLMGSIPAGRAFLLLFIVSALFISPILFAGVDYIDDSSRKLEGAYQWGSLGRPVTEWLMHVLTFNFGTMTDPGNLMQILCIPLLALTAFLVAKLLSNSGEISWMSLIMGMQIIPNQLLLTNLSFRFDSLSMILGNLVAVYAAYFLLTMPGRKYLSFIISALLLFVAACFYQSTILMFGMVVVAMLVAQYVRERKRLYPVFLKAVGVFMVCMLLYGAMTKLFQFSNLVGDRQDLVPFNLTGVRIALGNLGSGLKTVISFVSNDEAFLLATLIAGVIGVGLALTIYSLAKKRRVIDTIIVGLSPVFVSLLIMGPFILLLGSQLTTQTRVLTSVIGVMLLAVAATFALYKTGRRWAVWLLAIPLLMNVYSLGFAYTYGAALKAQRITDHSVYESIVATIQSRVDLRMPSILFIGGTPASPGTVLTQFDKRPGLKHMDIAGDNSRWYIWNRLKDERVGYEVELYSGKHSSQAAVEAICSATHSTPLVDNELYTLHKALDGVYVVWLKDRLTTGDLCAET